MKVEFGGKERKTLQISQVNSGQTFMVKGNSNKVYLMTDWDESYRTTGYRAVCLNTGMYFSLAYFKDKELTLVEAKVVVL